MIRLKPLLLVSSLFFSLPMFAQEQKLDVKGVYERAISEHIGLHPEDVVATTKGRVLFLRKEAYTKNLRDTIRGVSIVFVNPDSAQQVLPVYLSRKTKFTMLQMQQLFVRATTNYVYFYAMKTSWHPKKKKLQVPEYTDRICRVDFEYKLDHGDVNYTFKEAGCDLDRQ